MPNQGSQAKQILIAILLVVLGGVLGYKIRGNENIPGLTPLLSRTGIVKVQNIEQPTEFKDVDFGEFWDIWGILEESYIDPEKVKPTEMVYGAIKGMTSSLEDPYTMFLPPDDQKRSEEDLSGAFYGVGIQLDYVDNVLAVGAPLKGSPAEQAGLKAKDLILHVKDNKIDKDTQGWSLAEAVGYIRGERGTKVTLTLLRRDEKPEPFEVTLTRDEIVVPSAELQYVDLPNGQKAAVITLSRFGERTESELNTAIADIQRQSPKVAGVILDMRNNPGGFLDGAVDVASEFIGDGVIVTQQGRNSSRDYIAKGNARLAQYPVEVVVNGGSASAAEIVAGALRDRKGAKLIGEKTFGKGTVQDALRLPSGAGLHVTIAKWILPNGDWIQETGIPVNVEVKDDDQTEIDEVLERAKTELVQ
ncbi:S41 family peptidase [Patescibacteria group bacterium]|nr:S41 family peptidase [Patescibacteria group bacterium]